MDMTPRPITGEIWWAQPDSTVGREQFGRRPVLIVSNEQYHQVVTTLVITVPLTTTDRGWSNHVRVCPEGLGRASFAMTEQVRTISRQRLVERIGRVDSQTMAEVRMWISDWIR